MVTQNDINLLLQPTKDIHYKLEILDSNFRRLDSIEGDLISDNLSISADSNMRRTYNCELFVTNNKFLIGKDKYIWFTRYIRPYVGVKSQRTQAISWYCLGTFLFTDENYNFNAITSCEIIENTYVGLGVWFLAQSSPNPCHFLSDKSTRSIFGSII